MRNRFQIILVILLLLLTTIPVAAQTETPPPPAGPRYIIQPNDTLWDIAVLFNISVDDLLAANPDVDPDFISVGQELIIPGLEGVTGLLTTEIVEFGDTFRSMSRHYQISLDTLQRLNRIISPTELYAGASLIIPIDDETQTLEGTTSLKSGETFLEMAVRQNANPWTLSGINTVSYPGQTLPNDILYTKNGVSTDQANGLPSSFVSVQVTPLPLIQGGTTEIKIATTAQSLTGSVTDQSLQFFPNGEGNMVALQGIHAMLDPGLYPLKLEATLSDGSKQAFEQMVLVQSGYYPDDPVLLVEPETIDPTTSDNEMSQIADITSTVTPEKHWDRIFQNPSYFVDCFTSRYGNRRVYIGEGTDQKYYSFHSGLDFCGGEGLPITAPASGKIVFAGQLTIRGNATIIDHGWGVYSGIWHQSQINVQVGQTVAPGDVIGYVGGTGRVTGAHLHWEVWVNGIQVNPLTWLNREFP